jgi:hypothetical protein
MSNFFDAMYSKPKELSFVKPKGLDIFLCPAELLSWLEKAGEINESEVKGEYAQAVNSMCEYSCLWVCGKLQERYNKGELKGELYVCYGKFGFWEHYWIGYKIDGVEYFLDLTLAQFRKESPRFSVLIGKDAEGVSEYNDFVKVGFDEFFGRLERDWKLIESGEAKKMQDYWTNGRRYEMDELSKKLNDLDIKIE